MSDKSEFELPNGQKAWIDFDEYKAMMEWRKHKESQISRFGFLPVTASEQLEKEYNRLIQEDDERFFNKEV